MMKLTRMVMAQNIRHRQAIIKKRHVKTAGFKCARDALVIFGTQIILHGGGMAPRPDIIRAILRLQKGHQRHLLHWRIPLRSRSQHRAAAAPPQAIHAGLCGGRARWASINARAESPNSRMRRVSDITSKPTASAKASVVASCPPRARMG